MQLKPGWLAEDVADASAQVERWTGQRWADGCGPLHDKGPIGDYLRASPEEQIRRKAIYEESVRLRESEPGLVAARCFYYAKMILPAAREAAQACGYALAAHGSLARDIDLIAVPWEGPAKSPRELAEAIRVAVKAVSPSGECFATDWDHPGWKAYGRVVFSLQLGNGPYIDLSVTPRSPRHATDYERGLEDGGTNYWEERSPKSI